MKKTDTLIVVSREGDLPRRAGRVVTADEFLQGGGDLLEPGITVVNLCRSWRYLSKGYYVSLLADARGQTCLPTVDTIEALSNPEATFRRLQEAGVPTVELARLKGRQKLVPMTIAPAEDATDPSERPEVPLVRSSLGGSPTYLPLRDAELAETVVFMGICPDRGFQRIAAAVYRLWPVPVLRIRLFREETRWEVIDVAPVRFGRLSKVQRELLVQALVRRSRGKDAVPEALPEKDVAIAVLFDASDPKKPSSRETIERLEKVAATMDIHVHRIGPGDLARVGEYDALFVRTLTGIEEPAFRFVLQAETLGMPVIDDSRSIIRCGNKVFLHELLTREGIAIPDTMTVTRDTGFADVKKRLGVPFILKLPDGSFSTAVFKVTDRHDFEARTGELFRDSPLLIAQEWSPTDFDWRVGVLDGKVLFAARYYMAKGHWQIRASTPRGANYGRVEAVPRERVPREVAKLACRAATLIGHGLYGVDIKELPDGPVVIEINDNPNIDIGYEDAADGDLIYREIVSWFARELRPKPKEEKRPAAVRREARLEPGVMAPIGRMPPPPERPYRPFEVCGIELEYVIVDRDLNAVSLVEPVLASLAGRPTSDVELGVVGFSNEIMDHVFELKTTVPLKSLAETEQVLVEGVRRVAAVLADKYDARLLPTGMHPWFDPAKARVWTRSNRAVYRAYERLFPVRTHGWANVQAVHVNLPLGMEDEAVAMMNAAALLTPYLPALAASSPMYDGELQPAVDNRLAFIVEHQARIPESSGQIVPEFVESFSDYRKRVLRPMYRALDPLPDAKVLHREFLNARGAVFKFSRDSMEVRSLDMQECVKMDVAIASFVRCALRGIVERLRSRRIRLPEHARLVEDFRAVVKWGTAARVWAPWLNGRVELATDGTASVRDALTAILAIAEKHSHREDEAYLELVRRILERGNLSERMARVLEPHVDDATEFTEAARRLYIRLSECLTENEPWNGEL